MKETANITTEILTSTINNKEVNYIFEENSIWLSKADLATIFKMDISDFTYYIHEYFYDSNFDIESNIQNIYNNETGIYSSYLKLDFIISIGYRLKMYKQVKEVINLNRTTKSQGTQKSLLSTSEDLIEKRIQTIDKAIELIQYIKNNDTAIYS